MLAEALDDIGDERLAFASLAIQQRRQFLVVLGVQVAQAEIF